MRRLVALLAVLAAIVPASPAAAKGHPPVLTRFVARYNPSATTTFYVATATDAEGSSLVYQWSLSTTCGFLTEPRTTLPHNGYQHGPAAKKPSGCPVSEETAAVVSVRVTDAEGCSILYSQGARDERVVENPVTAPVRCSAATVATKSSFPAGLVLFILIVLGGAIGFFAVRRRAPAPQRPRPRPEPGWTAPEPVAAEPEIAPVEPHWTPAQPVPVLVAAEPVRAAAERSPAADSPPLITPMPPLVAPAPALITQTPPLRASDDELFAPPREIDLTDEALATAARTDAILLDLGSDDDPLAWPEPAPMGASAVEAPPAEDESPSIEPSTTGRIPLRRSLSKFFARLPAPPAEPGEALQRGDTDAQPDGAAADRVCEDGAVRSESNDVVAHDTVLAGAVTARVHGGGEMVRQAEIPPSAPGDAARLLDGLTVTPEEPLVVEIEIPLRLVTVVSSRREICRDGAWVGDIRSATHEGPERTERLRATVGSRADLTSFIERVLVRRLSSLTDARHRLESNLVRH